MEQRNKMENTFQGIVLLAVMLIGLAIIVTAGKDPFLFLRPFGRIITGGIANFVHGIGRAAKNGRLSCWRKATSARQYWPMRILLALAAGSFGVMEIYIFIIEAFLPQIKKK